MTFKTYASDWIINFKVLLKAVRGTSDFQFGVPGPGLATGVSWAAGVWRKRSRGQFELSIQGSRWRASLNSEDRRDGPAGRDGGGWETTPVVPGLCKEGDF